MVVVTYRILVCSLVTFGNVPRPTASYSDAIRLYSRLDSAEWGLLNQGTLMVGTNTVLASGDTAPESEGETVPCVCQ